jgi:hypothetical protein
VLPARPGPRDYRGLQGVGLLILTAAGAVACAEPGPPGTTVVVTTDSLTPGVTYTVYVGRGFRGAPAGGTDSRTFTPN